MLYKLFLWLFRLTANAYFRSIYIKGKENIPKDKPVIFAANHPSSFMDPILLGVNLNRSLYFLARGDIFKNKMVRKLFDKLHMIPVYKPDLSPDQVHKNEMIFEKCYEYLERNKAVMIFPEGISKTERRLRPIKTGIARIALGAEEKNNFNLDLCIVPIGLNYSNPHYFKSDVFVNIGAPISVSEYQEDFLKDSKEGVLQLTDRVKSELEKRIVIIEDEQLEKLIRQIEILYRSKLREQNKQQEKATQDFYLSQDIVEAVQYYAKNHPEILQDFEQKISVYLKRLKRLKIRDTQIRSSETSFPVFLRLLYFTFGFPLFLFGLITNIIPFKIVELIPSKVTIREDFVGAVKMATGMLIFLITYLVEASIFGYLTNFLWAILFILSLYPAGLFTVDYFKKYYQVRGTIKYLRIFMKKGDLIANLKTTRQELVDELEMRKEDFIKVRTSLN
jgi:glycerol-3-phosphate O-acyltransferase/dihydroxyacetone phosphate acyltransferase